MRLVITGATKGIGRAIVEKFAAEGFDILINARTKTDLVQFKTELDVKYPNQEFLIYDADLSEKSKVIALADFTKSKWEQFDVLVNNAGVFLPGAISEEAEGTLEKMINTNLYSAYYLTRGLLPLMQNPGSHIFNMCSIASQIAYPNGGSYSISKFALLGFSKVLREEMKEKSIKVTSILPGATWSASWAGVELPESRLMQASDIANSVWSAWTMSPSAVVEEIVIRPQLGDL